MGAIDLSFHSYHSPLKKTKNINVYRSTRELEHYDYDANDFNLPLQMPSIREGNVSSENTKGVD